MIGIDGNEANVGQRVGSNVYAYNILKGLAHKKNRLDYQVYLKNSPRLDLPNPTNTWKYKVLKPSPLWTQWRLPLDLYTAKPKPDLFFTPGHYAPRFSPMPSVISILDLSFLYFPEAFQPKVLKQLKDWTAYSARQATHILAISESTKKDIVKEYKIDPQNITVTYLGSNTEKPKVWSQTEKERILKKYQIKTKYFLFVGTRQPKKNLDRLIMAFNKLQSRERNVSLVIVGKKWHQFTQTEANSGQNIVFTGFVDDSDLSKLILGSEALVFPSLYEGFGIPVLEAMNLGTLVAASNVSSIPEVTGSTPLLFDPLKTPAIEKTLQSILRMSSDKKKKLVREGKIRAKNFTWTKCVDQTLEVLKTVYLQSST